VELVGSSLSSLREADSMTRRPSSLIRAQRAFDRLIEVITAGFQELAGSEALDRQLEQLAASVSDDFVAAADSLLMASRSGDSPDSRYTAEYLASGRDLWPHFREVLRCTVRPASGIRTTFA